MSIRGTSEFIGLYLDSSNRLTLSINGTVVGSTNTKIINDSNWHHIILRYKNSKLQIYLDSLSQPLYDGTNSLNLSNTIIYLGNDSTGTKALNGCMEMFAISNQYATDTEILSLLTKGKTIIVRNKVDTLGRLNQNQILINDKDFVTNYNYDKTRVTKQILHNQDSITYSYDKMNNITSKTTLENGVESKVEYTYDKLGRLKSETKENGEKEVFTYYANGNVEYREVVRNNATVIKEKYIYDGVIKDKLVSIKDIMSGNNIQEITYDSSFVFNPNRMIINGVSKALSWQGRRLTDITGSTYQYNSEGIRTKKITPNETTTFELEGSNIISMSKVTSTENVRLDFVYDASATLIGVNTIEGHYFYIRDITCNILGLIDNEGNYIVKYKYDAWGKVLEKKILKSCLVSRHNPFVYKGYFLDEETGFYYLKSRYYDPTIRRFISIDSPGYISPEDLSGLNLYAYCGNNPIQGYDPDGNYDWETFWKCGVVCVGAALICGAVIVGTVATGGIISPIIFGAGISAIVNGGISYGAQEMLNGEVNAGQLVCDIATGFALGAFGGSNANRVIMTIAGGTIGFGGSIANDWIVGQEINWLQAVGAAGLGAMMSFAGGAGGQHGKTGNRKAALATKKQIHTKFKNGEYSQIKYYKSGLSSNKRRIANEARLLNRRAIESIYHGAMISFEPTVYQYMLFN